MAVDAGRTLLLSQAHNEKCPGEAAKEKAGHRPQQGGPRLGDFKQVAYLTALRMSCWKG